MFFVPSLIYLEIDFVSHDASKNAVAIVKPRYANTRGIRRKAFDKLCVLLILHARNIHILLKTFMPVTKSAIKNLRKSRKNTIRNKSFKSRVKDQVKELHKLVTAGNKDEAKKLAPKVESLIDRAAKKNLVHANKAARQKSALAKMVK